MCLLGAGGGGLPVNRKGCSLVILSRDEKRGRDLKCLCRSCLEESSMHLASYRALVCVIFSACQIYVLGTIAEFCVLALSHLTDQSEHVLTDISCIGHHFPSQLGLVSVTGDEHCCVSRKFL